MSEVIEEKSGLVPIWAIGIVSGASVAWFGVWLAGRRRRTCREYTVPSAIS
jgi:hypothetical protein